MSASRVISATVKAVARSKLKPTKAPLTLTPSAVTRIKNMMNSQPPTTLGLKIGVKTRGCNGLAYTLEYAHDKGKFDEEVLQDGVKILIDSKAQLTLLGTEMDYVEETLHSGFVFYNPNIKGTCGCGESFNV